MIHALALPGMDPYLESPDWFPDLHDGLIQFIKGELQARLPASYFALSRQRVRLNLEHRPPVERTSTCPDPRAASGGAVSTAEAWPSPNPSLSERPTG